MRFLLILSILLPSVIMVLYTIDFTYFAYSQQQQQISPKSNINSSNTLNSTNVDTNSSKSNTNKDLGDYLGYQYEYNFY